MINKEIKPYTHLAKYYETDQMAVVHHSNYIRWFEEARLDFLEQIGLSYETIEACGVYSPVLGVTCEYKSAVRFNEEVVVQTNLVYFDGIKMNLTYKVLAKDSMQVRAIGESKHCFVSKEFKPISLKKNYKQMFDILSEYIKP